MPKVKTSPDKQENTAIFQLITAVNDLKKQISEQSQAQISAANKAKKDQERQIKESENKAKKRAAEEKKYQEELKKIQDERKEDKWQANHDLAKNSIDAVMPADRRQFFGSAAIGTMMGIDPAFVKMLGIDKLGANVINSKFGFETQKKNHERNLEEKKLNEQYGISKKQSSSKALDKATESIGGGSTGAKEKYGSVVNDKDKNTKLLEKIANNTGAKKDSDGKIVTKEEKSDGGLFSKIFGVAKKFLIPILVGMIANAFRPMIKDGIANLLGGGDFGNFVGGALADFLPGAIGGLAYGLKNRAPLIPSALIGGTISFAIPRIRRTIDQIIGAFSSDQDPDAGNLDRYAEKAMTGAMIGASVVGWRKGTLKAAALGAGIGLATEFILARVNDVKAMLNGEPTEIKTVAGIPEAAFGGLVTGAMLGLKFGGFKGAMIGALIGGGAGMIWATVQDFRNQMIAAKSGKVVPPKEICGIPYAIATGLIGGAAIGFKFGGIWPGMVLGALIGGLAGFIANEVAKYKAKVAGAEANADEAMKGNADFQQIDAKNAEDQAIINDPNASEKEKNAAKARMALSGKVQEKTKEQLAGFAKWDENGDGILDDQEQDKLDRAWGKGSQSMAMQDAMKDLRSKGIEVTKENLMKYNADKLQSLQTTTDNLYGLPSNNMSTATQITENSEEQLDATKKTNEYLEKIAKAYEDPDNLPGRTEIINNGTAQQMPINAYGDTSGAGLVRQ